MITRSLSAATLASKDVHPTCREVLFESGLLLGIHLALALAVFLTFAGSL